MIQKKIHHVWLGDKVKPVNIRTCMESWQDIMPDYEIICWDETNFDLNSNRFVSEACKARKWAFAADYIRLWVLYNEGGIYLDTDVLILNRLDDFLNYDFFTSVEFHKHIFKRENSGQYLNSDGTRRKDSINVPGLGIQAAVLGSVKGNKLVRDCMRYYENRHFILENNSLFDKIIAPDIYARTAEKYGFIYRDEKQELANNIVIFPSEIFAGTCESHSDHAYAVHCCAGSWRTRPEKGVIGNITDRLKKAVNHYQNRKWLISRRI
jgi:hypothetical protein